MLCTGMAGQASLSYGMQFLGSKEAFVMSSAHCTNRRNEEVDMLVLFSVETGSGDLPTLRRDDFVEHVEAITLTWELADSLEKATREQASSQLWRDLHNGWLTSSRFGQIQRCQSSTCSDNLVTTLMGNKQQLDFLPPAMR